MSQLVVYRAAEAPLQVRLRVLEVPVKISNLSLEPIQEAGGIV